MSLTIPQHKAMQAILEGASMKEVAERAGVAPSTVWRWRMKDLQFKAMLQQLKTELSEQTMSKLQGLTGPALDSLWTILVDPTVSAGVRTNAIRLVLEFVFKGREFELESRLAELEAMVREGGAL
jgi:AcrR family transcriptional regulator